MANHNDETIMRLERDYPGWQVWVVYRVYGGPVWCARRWDSQPGNAVLNADSAEHLTEYLAEAQQ